MQTIICSWVAADHIKLKLINKTFSLFLNIFSTFYNIDTQELRN